MKNVSGKMKYFGRSLRKRILRQQLSCPYCGRVEGTVVDQKFGIVMLIECAYCGLLYRTPTDSSHENHDFYQADYSEDFTTDCPSDGELESLKETEFAKETNGYSSFLEVLNNLSLPKGSRVFDFGCSWGYGSYRLARAGYEVEAFEISAPRCAFAEKKLGIKATSDISGVGRDYDLFFSAHVLEHVPDLQSTIRFARGITRQGGLFVAFTPNGSEAYRKQNWALFHKTWGLVHPNFLQDAFYQHVFKDDPYLIASAPPTYPLERLASWNRQEQIICDTSGWELMVAAVL
jgi:transcription elongation factor Elf1